MKTNIVLLFSLLFILGQIETTSGQDLPLISSESVSILDTFHYSKIFGDTRKYRVFFPPSYQQSSEKKYPVIYFFHGWAQRYFGEMGLGYSHYDKGDDNDGDNIEAFVQKRDVIVVKVDGSNQFPSEDLNLSPWNMSNVTTFRQFPIYFEELVKYIDKNYRTIPDRHHRAVSGLSMGGFMTFWLSGKYPHLLSGAGNFCGSLEFEIGPLEFPVEYNHIDMYDNYEGVNLRLHYGTQDRLRYGHQDLNKIWPQVLDNYQYQIYEASHITCGLGTMFESLYQTFSTPKPDPETWHHIDVYPSFDIWGYEVTTDRVRSGFTVLKNVNIKGFSSVVRDFVPDGEEMTDVNMSIITPPIYKANSSYIICDYTPRLDRYELDTISSSQHGILTISLDGSEHHIGISEFHDVPNISVLSIHTENMPWLQSGKDAELSMKLLNKGHSDARDLRVELTAAREAVEVLDGSATLPQITSGKVEEINGVFTIRVPSDTIEIVRLHMKISDRSGNTWRQHYDLPVRNDEQNLDGEAMIADGILLTVVNEAVDSVTAIIGVGNGDGIPNPGESIVVLIKNRGRLYRTNTFTSDPHINANGRSMRTSDPWANYDHIGPSAKFTTAVISPDCPDGNELKFWVEYWIPKNPEHIIKRGVVDFKVVGASDETPPVFKWLQIKNDKKLEIGTYDASTVREVKVTMIPDQEASTIQYVRWDKPESFVLQLSDDGLGGDNVPGDSVFSGIIQNKASYVYRAVVTITDSMGNSTSHNYDKTIFIQDLR